MNLTAPENELSYFVGFVNGSDPDIFDDQDLSFYIESSSDGAASAFSLVNPSATTWFSKLFVSSNVALNYEAQSQYAFTVCVEDSGSCTAEPCGCSGSSATGMSSTARVIVSVEDRNDPPVLHCDHASSGVCSTFSVPENSANGTVVGRVNCTDEDGDPLTFVLVSEDGTSRASHFRIIPSHGTIVFQLEPGASLDPKHKSRSN